MKYRLILFFLAAFTPLTFSQDLLDYQFNNVSGTIYVYIDDIAKVGDSIKLTNSEIKTILGGLKLKKISYSGACDYLCGESGIFVRMYLTEPTSQKKQTDGSFILDFGFGCQETKEACIDTKGGAANVTFIYSYDSIVEEYLKTLWKNTQNKYKTKLDSLELDEKKPKEKKIKRKLLKK